MTANLTAERFASTVLDYVVIGGGTAGLVVAARLSEDPAVNVGVIEAGDWDPNVPNILIPGLGGTLMGNPKYDWGFSTVPQKHVNGRRMPQPRGKGLGGSSLMNFMLFDRASGPEYDAIEALGNPGWNWNEFLKYFKKSEVTLPPDPDHAAQYSLATADSRWHGDSGPIAKSYSLHFAFGPLHNRILQAVQSLGVPYNPEPDGGNKVGVSTVFTAIDTRTVTRSYSGNAYFEPNAGRENLLVLTGATVSKIVFTPGSSPLQATGVEFLKDGRKYQVAVNKEVIVSAGSYQTPQILELSGIGNKALLSKYGIETLIDLPGVGENLLVSEIDPQYETLDLARDPEAAASLQQLFQLRRGPLTSAPSVTMSFIPANTLLSEQQQQKWADGAREAAKDLPPGLQKQYEKQIERFLDYSTSAEGEVMPFAGFLPVVGLEPRPKARYMSIASALMHPLSRGSAHIVSADPSAAPAIDPNYFAIPEDMDVLLATVRFALRLQKTAPLGEVVCEQLAPTAEEIASDDAMKEYIKNNCVAVYHPVGTASMLPREDGGVVDPTLKVYGTTNVRVVDASILPLQIAAHTQATVYALAEKAADIIRGLSA